jgi:hypothetical protein
MALNTYAGLSTGVFRRLNRTADTTVFDDCISLMEAEVNRRLALSPVRPMHTVATATLDAEFIAQPTGLIDVDSFKIADAPILFTSPENMQDMFNDRSDTGQPRFYTLIGTEFRFYPEPDQSYTGSLTYWGKVPNLNSTDTSNWLLASHPDVYFHGVLAHAYQEYFDPENADAQAALFDIAIQKVLDAYPHRQDRRGLRTEITQNQISGWRSVLV